MLLSDYVTHQQQWNQLTELQSEYHGKGNKNAQESYDGRGTESVTEAQTKHKQVSDGAVKAT